MKEVEDFLYQQAEEQRAIMLYLHQLLMQLPGVHTKIRYQIPFYYRKSWICYLNPRQDGSVELAFTRANELSNVQGLLNFRERKQVAGMIWQDQASYPEEQVMEVIQEALLLDESVPYASKRKRR